MTTTERDASLLGDYLSSLADRAQHPPDPQPKAAEREQFRERATPLSERVRQLIKTIPPEEQAAGMSIDWFRERLLGRFKEHPRAGDVARALRAVGWIRQRAWRDHENGFRAKWYPPAANTAQSNSTEGGVI